MLEIKNLHVAINKKNIIKGLNLNIKPGEVHILFGPNGCGKSSLLKTVMGLPQYSVKKGDILYKKASIKNTTTDKIAKKGIGLAFQDPPKLKDVKVTEFLKAIKAKSSSTLLKKFDLQSFKNRDINEGFSGGEIKRWEVFKLAAQDADLLLFDEPESGVDMEHLVMLGKAIKTLLKGKKSALIITHTGFILNYIKAHKGHIMKKGTIIKSGDPQKLFSTIQKRGY